jgi:hypothetical protein
MPQMVMSALPPKADVCDANRHVCFGAKSGLMRRKKIRKDRREAASPNLIWYFGYAASTAAFFFLRQPSRPSEASIEFE